MWHPKLRIWKLMVLAFPWPRYLNQPWIVDTSLHEFYLSSEWIKIGAPEGRRYSLLKPCTNSFYICDFGYFNFTRNHSIKRVLEMRFTHVSTSNLNSISCANVNLWRSNLLYVSLVINLLVNLTIKYEILTID